MAVGPARPPRHRPALLPARYGLRSLATVGDFPAGHQPAAGARDAPGADAAGRAMPAGLRATSLRVAGLRVAGGWVSADTWRATANLGISLVLGGLFSYAVALTMLLTLATAWILGLGTMVRAGALWFAVQLARVESSKHPSRLVPPMLTGMMSFVPTARGSRPGTFRSGPATLFVFAVEIILSIRPGVSQPPG